MARKTGHTARQKKSSRQARSQQAAVRKRQPIETDQPAAPVSDAPEPEVVEAAHVAEAAPRSASRARTRPYRSGRPAAVARSVTASTFGVSREQEYAFIREDLRRLLYTAGALILVMLVLLFAIER